MTQNDSMIGKIFTEGSNSLMNNVSSAKVNDNNECPTRILMDYDSILSDWLWQSK